MAKVQCVLVFVITLALIRSTVAQGNEMSVKQASQILAEAGAWPQPSYISPEQASAIFHFNGNLVTRESARFGDTANISNVLIKPQDNSFDHIRLAIAKGGALVDRFQALANAWPSSTGSDQNPFTPLTLSSGAKGYFDGHGSVVLKSPDGRFDISIEVALSDSRGSTNVTDSNKGLIAGLMKSNDHGLKFLTDAMAKIAPLARQKYQNQVNAHTEIEEAMNVVASAGAVKPSPSVNPSPLWAAASPSPILTPHAVASQEESTWFLFPAIAILAVGAIGWFLLRQRGR